MTAAICTPWIALTLMYVVWMYLRDTIPFERLFPVARYRIMLESMVFFIPAGMAGWWSIIFTHIFLESEGNSLGILEVVGLVIIFIVEGVLILAMGVKEVPKDGASHDLIALGLGLLAGLLYGAYSLIIVGARPLQFLNALSKNPFLLFSLMIIGYAIIYLIVHIIGRLLSAGEKEPERPEFEPEKSQLGDGSDLIDTGGEKEQNE